MDTARGLPPTPRRQPRRLLHNCLLLSPPPLPRAACSAAGYDGPQVPDHRPQGRRGNLEQDEREHRLEVGHLDRRLKHYHALGKRSTSTLTCGAELARPVSLTMPLISRSRSIAARTKNLVQRSAGFQSPRTLNSWKEPHLK